MIISYDKNPNLSTDHKLKSLSENVQLALNELDGRTEQTNARLDVISKSMLAKTADFGTLSPASVAAGTYADTQVTFNQAFKSLPVVVACFISASTAASFGNCTLSVLGRSTSGFTVRIFNNDSSAREPDIAWIAIGD